MDSVSTTRRMALLVFVLGATSIGCNKASKADQAKKESNCTFKHEGPKFCFTPPPGMTAESEKKLEDPQVKQIYFYAGRKNLTIEWADDHASYERTRKSDAEIWRSGGAPVTQDANGFTSDWPKKSGTMSYHLIYVLRSGPGGAVSCRSNANEDEAAQMLAACKSLIVD